MIVTPIIALICIFTGWRHTLSGERIGMAVTQVLQWAAVLIAMYLLTVSDVERSLNANALGLMILTLARTRRLRRRTEPPDLEAVRHRRLPRRLGSRDRLASGRGAAALMIGVVLIALLFAYWWLRDRFRADA